MLYGDNCLKTDQVHTFAGDNMNQMYWNIIHKIQDDGIPSSPRSRPTQELLHVSTRLTNPRERVLTIPGRDWNPFFSLAETVWILMGKADVGWMLQFNSALAKVQDIDAPDPNHFHGAYGERLRRWGALDQLSNPNLNSQKHRLDQLLGVYNALVHDPDSRRAVAMIWNPAVDLNVESNDIPCNILLSFKLRANRLHLSVFNRSNDFLLGLSSTNIVQFTTIQEVVATWLGAEMGMYTHFSDSLHLYDSDPFRGGELNLGDKNTIPFDVYAHVDALPMVPRGTIRMPKGEWGPTLEDRWVDGWPQRALQPIWDMMIQSDAVIATEGGLPLYPNSKEEPYWHSVWNALTAYKTYRHLVALRRGRGLRIYDTRSWSVLENTLVGVILGTLAAMRMEDWYIECVRWLLAGKRLGPIVYDTIGPPRHFETYDAYTIRAIELYWEYARHLILPDDPPVPAEQRNEQLSFSWTHQQDCRGENQ